MESIIFGLLGMGFCRIVDGFVVWKPKLYATRERIHFITSDPILCGTRTTVNIESGDDTVETRQNTNTHTRTYAHIRIRLCVAVHTHTYTTYEHTQKYTKLGITWTLLVDGTTVFIATRKVLHTTHLIRHRHQPININTRKEAIHKQKSQIFETNKATAAKSWLSFARYFANRMFCWNFDIILLNGRAFPIDRTKNRKKTDTQVRLICFFSSFVVCGAKWNSFFLWFVSTIIFLFGCTVCGQFWIGRRVQEWTITHIHTQHRVKFLWPKINKSLGKLKFISSISSAPKLFPRCACIDRSIHTFVGVQSETWKKRRPKIIFLFFCSVSIVPYALNYYEEWVNSYRTVYVCVIVSYKHWWSACTNVEICWAEEEKNCAFRWKRETTITRRNTETTHNKQNGTQNDTFSGEYKRKWQKRIYVGPWTIQHQQQQPYTVLLENKQVNSSHTYTKNPTNLCI